MADIQTQTPQCCVETHDLKKIKCDSILLQFLSTGSKSLSVQEKLFISVIQHFTQVNLLFNTESNMKLKSL